MSNRNITSKSQRVAFRMPLDLVGALDWRAEEFGTNRSAVLVDTLRRVWDMPEEKSDEPRTRG